MATKSLQGTIPKHGAHNIASRHRLGYNRGTLCCAPISGTLRIKDSTLGWDDWTILVSFILLIPSTIKLAESMHYPAVMFIVRQC